MIPFYGPLVQDITAEVVTPDGDWVTLRGWDVPRMKQPNPSRGVLRMFSGPDPYQWDLDTGGTPIDLTESIFNRFDPHEWYFAPGYWRRAHFGEIR